MVVQFLGSTSLRIGLPVDFNNKITSEQYRMSQRFAHPSLKETHNCDGYLWIDFPEGHPNHEHSQRSYWARQFGFSRGKDAKGIAVIMLPGGVK